MSLEWEALLLEMAGRCRFRALMAVKCPSRKVKFPRQRAVPPSPSLPTPPLGDRDQSVGAPTGRTVNLARRCAPRLPRNQGVWWKRKDNRNADAMDGGSLAPPTPNPQNQKLGTGDVDSLASQARRQRGVRGWWGWGGCGAGSRLAPVRPSPPRWFGRPQ